MLNCVFGFTNKYEDRKEKIKMQKKYLQRKRKHRHPKKIKEILVVNHNSKSK